MNKMLVTIIALTALLSASGASAATTIVRLGVDDDETGFVYEYNYLYNASCSVSGCDGCKDWWTNRLPIDVYGVHVRLYKDNSSEYDQCDWDAFDEDTFEENPDTYTYVPATGNRVYEMEYYWDESQYYWYTEYARFDYKYNDDGPLRCRFFYVTPLIE